MAGRFAEEQVPGNDVQPSAPTTAALVSLKAALLLREYKLDSAVIPHQGERISAEDVERYVQSNGLLRPSSAPPALIETTPNVSGKVQHLTSEERAMLRTVLWHRDSAVPGYIEFPYDPKPWAQYAAQFQQMHKLMFDPLLALMAFRLSSIAGERPLLNSTIVGDSRHLYDHVNLGFTVQVGTTLYMVVIRGAEALTEKELVDRLSRLQISAMKKSLRADEVTGATLAFTSMSRWPVTRHLPILPPHVSFIAAHVGAAVDGSSPLGATYDHRVLTGFDVVEVLREFGQPPKTIPPEKTNE